MDTKEYIVTTHKADTWFTNDGLDGLYHELTREGAVCSFVPYRPVEVLNHRPYTPRCFHLALTDEEAKTLLLIVKDHFISTKPDSKISKKCKYGKHCNRKNRCLFKHCLHVYEYYSKDHFEISIYGVPLVYAYLQLDFL